MSLKIYNTLTKSKEEFKPITPGKVGIYVCGITAYDSCHVGHGRSAVVFDVVARYFRYCGYEVTYVKNFTDVDDKIIDRAKREGLSIGDIAERYIRAHDEDMDYLGVARPTAAPRATDHIDDMIRLIGILLDKGLAYRMDGDVYYAVDKFAPYGKLSGRVLQDMIAGARVDVNEKKRNPLDFALWKASKEGEPWWESPWGRGRPGWHIECSCMSQKYLGPTFDIHGGGEDLIFPHHENEIAQSEGASGLPLANYWMHNGFVRINNEKMSKSIGNIFTIADIRKNFHAEAVRLFMLQSHYRSPVDFSPESLAEARLGMERFYANLKALDNILASTQDLSPAPADLITGREKELAERIALLPVRFGEAMDDDFNTARAIGCVFDTVRLVNAYMSEPPKPISLAAVFVLSLARRTMDEIGAVLGLFRENPAEYFRKDRDREAGRRGIDGADVERLIAERAAARAEKDWKRADEIRQVLSVRRVVLKDSPQGTTWHVE